MEIKLIERWENLLFLVEFSMGYDGEYFVYLFDKRAQKGTKKAFDDVEMAYDVFKETIIDLREKSR